MSINIGENIIESLTTGLYTDCLALFREYIQNSCDSIDDAIKNEILIKEDARIDIIVDSEAKQIKIRDNGEGVKSANIKNILGDIGKSTKNINTHRGFRGIGRLSGLGYCDELQFVTSAINENKKTVMTWKCKDLFSNIHSSSNHNREISELLNTVITYESLQESEDEHYFEVILNGVDTNYQSLLDIISIKNYISESAPVPFDNNNFTFSSRIYEYLEENSVEISEYNIFLNDQIIFKLYNDEISNNGKSSKLRDVEFFEDSNTDGLLFVGWYGVRTFDGIIRNKSICGIRARKQNFLVGDGTIFDSYFSKYNGRFNRWYVGEVYFVNQNVIPNAARNNFKQTPTIPIITDKLKNGIFAELVKLPTTLSRLKGISNLITRHDIELKQISNEIVSGFSELGKDRLQVRLKEMEQKLEIIKYPSCINSDIESEVSKLKKIILDQQSLINVNLEELKQADFVTEKNIKLEIPNNVNEILEGVFDVLNKSLPDGLAKELQDRIIESLNSDN